MKQNSLTDIQKSCAMTKGDVKHVIEALVEEVQENLANGNKVKLNQFGTFYMTFCCPGVATSAECTVKNIKRVRNWKIWKADHRMEVIPAATPVVMVA